MRTPWLLLVPACLACAVASYSRAEEPKTSIEAVLAKWEMASQDCRTLDARLTVFQYDVFTGDQPTVYRGRFYYEAPNIGRYEIRGADGTPGWSGLSEAIIWMGDETLWIDGRRATCQRFSTAKLRASLAESDASPPRGLLGTFFAAIRQAAQTMQGPKHLVPLLIDVRAAEVRHRFDVSVEEGGAQILLKAVPKRESDQTLYREIGIILDATTHMPRAIRLVSPDNSSRTVYVLHEQKVNQRPSDRDALIAPDLSGLHVIEGP